MGVEDLDLLLQLAEEGAVNVEWEKGDLVLLDVSPQQDHVRETCANRIICRTTQYNILDDPGKESVKSWLLCGTTMEGSETLRKALSCWKAVLETLL